MTELRIERTEICGLKCFSLSGSIFSHYNLFSFSIKEPPPERLPPFCPLYLEDENYPSALQSLLHLFNGQREHETCGRSNLCHVETSLSVVISNSHDRETECCPPYAVPRKPPSMGLRDIKGQAAGMFCQVIEVPQMPLEVLIHGECAAPVHEAGFGIL